MLDERPEAFADSNLFLLGLLGLAAHREALARAIEAAHPTHDPLDHPIVDLLLGLHALAERFDGLLATLQAPELPARIEPTPTEVDLRALLRSS
jgi:hypothetical protein